MAAPVITTVRDQIAWSYANLARAHAALEDGRTLYTQTDHIIRSRLFKGLQTQTMAIQSIYADERIKQLAERNCVYCGGSDAVTIDHVIPRVAGGGDDGANLVLCCRPCNSSKGGSDMLVWYARRLSFPSLLLLRRYLKLIVMWCERHNLLDETMDGLVGTGLPFDLRALPTHFPPLSELRL